MRTLFFYILLLLIFHSNSLAEGLMTATMELPKVVGENRQVEITGSKTLMEVALHEGLGFEAVANSNHNIDPWNPGEGTEIILPEAALLPFDASPGLNINLAEMRLFHITEKRESYQVKVYPLGIGREGRETPEGAYRVVVKKERPDWLVPAGLRELDPSLPRVVPPGPENPLGEHWLGISAPGYGVHGTNRPYGVGRRVSYGCIRMYPKDIKNLFELIPVGTPVHISYQPVKAAWHNESLLLEVHPDYQERYSDLFQHALKTISQTGWPGEIDYSLVKKIVARPSSIPLVIGTHHVQ